MFEQTTLAAPASHRLFGTLAGVTCQVVLVGALIAVPLIFPQALPDVRSLVTLVAPGPPPPPPAPGPMVRPRALVTATHVFCPTCMPLHIPREIPRIVVDEPPAVAGTGVPGGVPGGIEGGVPGGLLRSILSDGPQLVPAPPAIRDAVKPAAATVPAAAVQRITGGVVKMANPIHRVEPLYPALARQMHVQGTVEIEGVIGVDGRMRELHVKSGHPLLVKAAVDAVRQWVYEPSTLNGSPVEVVGVIVVNFRLN
jgi:protein TonB